MQQHMAMIQAMMNSKLDRSKMMKMMGNSSMMKMNMMCIQMMQNMHPGNGMMNQGRMKNNDSLKWNNHNQHHK
jgi:hypothetical protein